MSLFRKKSILADPYPITLEQKTKVFKITNSNQYYLEQIILNRCSEGRNVGKNGKAFWVCSKCSSNIRFETSEEYVWHHQRVHA